jgi:hypothetical protein
MRIGLLSADIEVIAESASLWELMEMEAATISKQLKIEDINKIPTIAAAR